jgi:hypothetical protein
VARKKCNNRSGKPYIKMKERYQAARKKCNNPFQKAVHKMEERYQSTRKENAMTILESRKEI